MKVTIDQMVEHLCEDLDENKAFMMGVHNTDGDVVIAMPFPEDEESLSELKAILVALTVPLLQIERGDLTVEEIKAKVEEMGTDEFIDRVLH
jgi:hypothetical protein